MCASAIVCARACVCVCERGRARVCTRAWTVTAPYAALTGTSSGTAAIGATSVTVSTMTTAAVAGMTVTGHVGIPVGTTVKAGSTTTQIDLDFTAPATGLTGAIPANTVLHFGSVSFAPLTGTVGSGSAAIGATSLTLATAMSPVVVKGMQVTGHAGIPAGTTVKTGSTATQIELDFTAPATGLTAQVPASTVISFKTVIVKLPESAQAATEGLTSKKVTGTYTAITGTSAGTAAIGDLRPPELKFCFFILISQDGAS